MNIQNIIKFLAALQMQNNREYFESVRPQWQLIKAEVTEFVGTLLPAITEFDSAVSLVDPRTTLYRINKDIRFSRDKRPYKSWVAVGITPQKKADMKPVYYFHIDYGGRLEVGSGSWGAKPEDTKIVREAILANPDSFKKMIQALEAQGYYLAKGFQKTRLPHGYPKDHELAEYIKYTSFAIEQSFEDVSHWSEEKLRAELLHFFAATSPLVQWIRTALTKRVAHA